MINLPFPFSVNKGITTKKRTSKSSSTGSSISTMELERIIEKLKNSRNRPTTNKNYYTIWKQFNNFILKLDIKPRHWEERLTLFVGYLVDTKKKSTTIRSYISAIKTVLLSENIKLKEDKYLINSLICACKYVNDVMLPRLSIKKHLLRTILDTTYSIFTIVNNQPYLSFLYRAMFSTTYHGLFRVGELAKGEHPVLVQDVHIAMNKNKILFILRTSKTHWKDSRPQ